GEPSRERDDHLRFRERQHSSGTPPVHAGTHRRRLGHQRSADVLSPRHRQPATAQRVRLCGGPRAYCVNRVGRADSPRVNRSLARARGYWSWMCTATGDSCSTVLLTVQSRSWERWTAFGNTSCAFCPPSSEGNLTVKSS